MAYTRFEKNGIIYYQNEDGKLLSTRNDKMIFKDGLAFKNLSKTDELLPYEDWRLDDDARAEDLSKRLSYEQIAGLMLYSSHQSVPCRSGGPFKATYNGVSFEESGLEPYAMSDAQKQFLEEDNIRHVLVTNVENTPTVVKWSNNMQAYCEEAPLGIPINFSTDPRNGARKAGQEFKSGANDVSKWPEGLGMAATFDPVLCEEYASIISNEYRAMGIATALSPQIDLACEPRWMRFEDTFGSHPQLVTDMARAYVDGMQNSGSSGWGKQSVNAMAKHWPGGATGESGRDAHYAYGKYAVYPGNQFETHLKPFTDGAFNLNGPTQRVSSIMPYYTVSWGIDTKYNQNVGNAYSKYIIQDLLRKKYAFDGIICTDWGVVQPSDEFYLFRSGKNFGLEEKNSVELHTLAIENGIDQFGGNNEKEPVLKAFEILKEKYGEDVLKERLNITAKRLLKAMFRCGLFDDPYLDEKESVKVTGCEEYSQKGYEAQLKSLVLLKNEKVLPVKEKKKVYIPNRTLKERMSFFLTKIPEQTINPIDTDLCNKYFDRVDDVNEADFGLVFIESPICDCFDVEEFKNGGNGYLPIMLQYRPYTAVDAREVSIAGGDPREKSTNRSYKNKTNTACNEYDLDNVINTKKALGNKPLIVVIRMHNSTVLSELEPYADAILCDFGVQMQAILDTLSGKNEPSGLLPIQLPKNMTTVEKHCEDMPFDLDVYTDSVGNAYDFGFGLNFTGIIQDERNKKYHK